MNEKNIIFLAPLARLEQRTRLAKFAQVYQDLGLSTSHWGWDRDESDTGLPAVTAGTKSTSLHFGGGKAAKGLGKHYLRWSMALLLKLLRDKPPAVHALGPEAAIPVALARLVGRGPSEFIYDDADRFSLSHSLPRAARTVFQAIERLVSRSSDLHIVPGLDRYPDGIRSKRTLVLKNTPSKAALDQMMGDATLRSDDYRLTLLVTGWIGDTRGAKLLNQLADAFGHDPSVRFLAAGRTTGQHAQEFVERSNVTYFGVVENSQALDLCAAADLVFTLYDPAILINQYAEPNKWGDCEALGVPFAVNSEVVTARPYLEIGMAASAPYADLDEWRRLIAELLENPIRLAELRANAQTRVDACKTFEEQVVPTLRLLAGLPKGNDAAKA